MSHAKTLELQRTLEMCIQLGAERAASVLERLRGHGGCSSRAHMRKDAEMSPYRTPLRWNERGTEHGSPCSDGLVFLAPLLAFLIACEFSR